MTGPFPIDEIELHVEAGKAGVYVFTRRRPTPHYVGRSDTCLLQRMPVSVDEGEGYTHFWFEYCSSPQKAYYRECELFHQFEPPDNSNHPAVPKRQRWRCPIDDCEWAPLDS